MLNEPERDLHSYNTGKKGLLLKGVKYHFYITNIVETKFKKNLRLKKTTRKSVIFILWCCSLLLIYERGIIKIQCILC